MNLKNRSLHRKCGVVFMSVMTGLISVSHAHAQYIKPGSANNNPDTNYEHCIKMVTEGPNRFSTKFPKGTKHFTNQCGHSIYIAWCFYDQSPRFTPSKTGDCGLNSGYFQKSWTLKPYARHLSKMDIYQNFDMLVCKGTGKNSVNFKGAFNTTNKYDCKDLSQARG